MSKGLLQRHIIYFLLLVIVQIPLLHNWVFFDLGFPFMYIGFILLLPMSFGRGWLMTVGFSIGLMMDIFSNTPGMHASAAVLISYSRSRWFGIMLDASDDDLDLTIPSMGWTKFIAVFYPLVFVHHLTLFALENEGFGSFWHLFAKVFWSSIISFVLIGLVAAAAAPKKKR